MSNKKKHLTEIKSPKQSEALQDLLRNAYNVYLDKNSDYSPANIVYAGEIGVLVRIWDKFCRLMNFNGLEFPVVRPKLLQLIEDIQNNPDMTKDDIAVHLRELTKATEFNWQQIKPKAPKNESIKDAWNDMAVYAFIGLLEHLKIWGR